MTLSLALVGNFDTVLGAWREAGGASLAARHRLSSAPPRRASVQAASWPTKHRSLPRKAYSTSDRHRPRHCGELPELRDAMSLVWRILLVWLAVLALFVIAGWVS